CRSPRVLWLFGGACSSSCNISAGQSVAVGDESGDVVGFGGEFEANSPGQGQATGSRPGIAALAGAPGVLVTLLVASRVAAAMRSTSDFLVASRRVSPLLNSAAVSGEYLSAASFLGVSGLVVKDGIGALWYPVGFTAGYIAMLALVAAPMRRSGAL